ncbi:MAG: ATP-binding protein, partial [Candidatus Acidiferrum sp.]
SSSMYVDPMSMYREYIQNAADAVELARSTGVLSSRGRVHIRIDQSSRSVSIRDNGAGLGNAEFVDQLMALGGSKKRGTSLRGFRGVGRLAGLAFCQELVFRSRQSGEPTVHELRWDSREIRGLLRSADRRQNLKEVITRGVQKREVRCQNYPARFFEVELKGVVRHRDDRLLSHEAVNRYLAQVAPVGFHSDFGFAQAIESFLRAHGVPSGVLDIELVDYGPVFRPHRNVVAMGKSGETRFRELRTLVTPGRDAGTAAVTWSLDHDYRGALPTSSLIEGWRFRAGDIQVGDNALLQALFPESRFNAWCVAETHVLDPRILPNGRRDHFEQNAHYFDLLNHLAPQVREIAQRCRNSSIARNLVRTIDTRLTECAERIRILEKGTLAAKSAGKIIRALQNTLQHLQRISAKNSIAPERQRDYQLQIDRLQQRLGRVASDSRRMSILRAFPPSQRPLLVEVFAAIYQADDNLQHAQTLVDTIVSRLRRARRRPRKRKIARR